MKKYFGILILTAVALGGCNKDGCVDPTALNYDSKAENDDGSCVYLAQNLNMHVHSKLGANDFAYNTEATTDGGRKVKFTRIQMYVGGFTFNGNSGQTVVEDSEALIKPEVSMYELGYLPEGTFNSISFHAGVDSVSNHSDPATFQGASALSSNNPDHMHWGWDPGYIFYVLEGEADTTAGMNGDVNAPFIFHVGMDMHKVDLAFVKEVNSTGNGVTIHTEIDWLKLLDGTNMTGEVDSRSTHTMNNPPLAALMVSNIDDAISIHQ
ncbi:MAG: MbnP family protein [Flavobacteriales bacterium]